MDAKKRACPNMRCTVAESAKQLPMQRPHIVDVDVLLRAEGRDDDRQADRRFSRGDGDDDESKDVAGVLQPRARERDEERDWRH